MNTFTRRNNTLIQINVYVIIVVLVLWVMATTFIWIFAYRIVDKNFEDLKFAENMCMELEQSMQTLEKELQYHCERADFFESELPPVDIRIQKLTRGMRNKNPMNIAALGSSDPWKGQIGADDIGLAKFETYEHGLRAGYITLVNFQQKHGKKNLLSIMQRYCEGDYEKYASVIARRIGVTATTDIDVRMYMPEIMKAIIEMENGYQPFPETYFIPYDRY